MSEFSAEILCRVLGFDTSDLGVDFMIDVRPHGGLLFDSDVERIFTLFQDALILLIYI